MIPFLDTLTMPTTVAVVDPVGAWPGAPQQVVIDVNRGGNDLTYQLGYDLVTNKNWFRWQFGTGAWSDWQTMADPEPKSV